MSDWATWLGNQLAGRPQKYLVDRSEGRIKPDAVSRWMKGNRPSIEAAIEVADIFGASRDEALRVAGYGHLAGKVPANPQAEQSRLTSNERAEILTALRELRTLADDLEARLRDREHEEPQARQTG